MELDPAFGDQVATTFGLDRPLRAPRPVQHTSFRTWRVDTTEGAFLLKQLWQGADPLWWPNLAAMMAFERRVHDAGIATATPVQPVIPAFGYAARIADRGMFRCYEWLEHRAVGETDDLTVWLAQTLVAVHRLGAAGGTFASACDWFGLYPREQWDAWIAKGIRLRHTWPAIVRAHLDDVLDLSRRLAAVWERAGDAVVTHGDVDRSNVLLTTRGPVLIDWESVAYDSMSLEVGRTALAFGYGDPKRVRRLMDAYQAEGGAVAALGRDIFLRRAALALGHITELIMTAVGEREAVGWMLLDDLDTDISERVHTLPNEVTYLSNLAAALGYASGR